MCGRCVKTCVDSVNRYVERSSPGHDDILKPHISASHNLRTIFRPYIVPSSRPWYGRCGGSVRVRGASIDVIVFFPQPSVRETQTDIRG